MITGVDRAVFIKYNTGALSTGVIRSENSVQYKFGAYSAGVISDDDMSV